MRKVDPSSETYAETNLAVLSSAINCADQQKQIGVLKLRR